MSGEAESLETQFKEELDVSYKPPPPKSIDELLSTDQDDNSLRKYKETLLGTAKTGSVLVDASDTRKVIVKNLILLLSGRDSLELDLTQDLNALNKPFIIKEGVHYRIRIDFYVQREIVHGLKYIQKTHRKGILVDKVVHMVGSYAPKLNLQSFTTPEEEAPSGLLSRGNYTIKSLFTDDDNTEHLKWEWQLEIRKDWP